MTAVSILTPVYHGEETLPDAIQSVIAQTFTDWEMLIIADDGRDYTWLAKQIPDPRLRFLSTSTPRSGPGVARNTGLQHAHGRLVVTLDHDDTIPPNRLEKTVPHAWRYGAASTGLECLDESGTLLMRVGCSGEERLLGTSAWLRRNFSSCTMLMFDRQRTPDQWSEDTYEDVRFAVALLDRLGEIYHLPEPLLRYVKRTKGVSGNIAGAERIRAVKQKLIADLSEGLAGFSRQETHHGFGWFLSCSLEAEQRYVAALKAGDRRIFEHHVESLLEEGAAVTR